MVKPAKLDRFLKLASEVRACRDCPRMGDSQRVLGPGSGPLSARLMFIGEAPGRLGADVSGIPFHGDIAGDNFERLVDQSGLSRHDMFVTNCVLCNPRAADGNNATPTATEVGNCSKFLRAQIDLLEPSIVVTLGAQALRALASIQQHEIELAKGIRRCWTWYGRLLIPAYHPGQRAMIHRSFAQQLEDYKFIAAAHGQLHANVNTAAAKVQVAAIANHIVGRLESVSYFKLHKLFYLVEYEHFLETGRRASRAYIIRQKDGPYVTDLQIKRLKKTLDDIEIRSKGSKLFLSQRADLFFGAQSAALEGELGGIIAQVLQRYGELSDAELKTAAYMTRPMRQLLRREKSAGAKLYNAPLEFTLPASAVRAN
jgi:uracil-DNA glycosylase family 4